MYILNSALNQIWSSIPYSYLALISYFSNVMCSMHLYINMCYICIIVLLCKFSHVFLFCCTKRPHVALLLSQKDYGYIKNESRKQIEWSYLHIDIWHFSNCGKYSFGVCVHNSVCDQVQEV